jgi:hypothetical protein
VPSGSEKYPSLGNWVHYQRRLKRRGLLRAERRRRLARIDFDWVSRGRSLRFRDSKYWETNWERMLARLKKFKRRFGHCFVPKTWPGRPNLHAWVSRQRRLKQRGLLSEERWLKLQKLRLDWRTGESVTPRWERCFLKLLEFRSRFGHSHVPAEWAEDINLGRWVVKTRRLRKAGRLRADRVRRLNEIGFVWNPIKKRQSEHDVLWARWLARLQAFRQKHGHWRVPTDEERYHGLRVWMDNQRISYQRGWLTRDRIRRLKAIGFPWLSDRGQQLAQARAQTKKKASAKSGART